MTTQPPPASDRDAEPADRLRRSLDQALADLRQDAGKADLVALLSYIRTGLDGGGAEADHERARLIDEIRVLAGFIDAARQDLIALRPRDIQERFIPTASDELDAIVQATETATEDIMDCCEGLEAMIGRLAPEDAETLTAATTRIYEACAFQDITGQRITKVVRTLKSIEERIDAMVATFGAERGDLLGLAAATDPDSGPDSDEPGADLARYRRTVQAVGDREVDVALLNGPQKAGAAMNQTDIDALLNGDG